MLIFGAKIQILRWKITVTLRTKCCEMRLFELFSNTVDWNWSNFAPFVTLQNKSQQKNLRLNSMNFVKFADFPPLFQSFATHFASSNRKLWPIMRLQFVPFPSKISKDRFEIHSKLDSISKIIDSKLCSWLMNVVPDRHQSNLRCHLSKMSKSLRLEIESSWTTCCWQLTRNQFFHKVLTIETNLDDHMEDAKLEKPLTCNARHVHRVWKSQKVSFYNIANFRQKINIRIWA